MDDRKIRYNRDFLKWSKTEFELDNNKYVPEYHIFPHKGLLNDPNCVFYKNNNLYVFFQHHPNNPIHGLKTMSLAKIDSLQNIEYKFMVNKPLEYFETHGIYSGNAINYNGKVICFYTGNSRDTNWKRTSYVIKSEFDSKINEFVNKEVILSNKEYLNYTEHFRDPFVFEYKKKFYFLLGAQRNKDQLGVILLFGLDNNLSNPKLIKEFLIDLNYRMIECPSFSYIDNKVVIICSPQFKEDKLSKQQNPDITGYCIIDDFDKIISSNNFSIQIPQLKVLDYGLEFYAPQSFLINNEWHLIAWCGIPTSNNYLEYKNGWIFMLTMIKKMSLINDQLVLIEDNLLKKRFKNSKNNLVNFFELNLKQKEKIIICDEQESKPKLLIINNDDFLIIERNNDEDFYPYDSITKVPIKSKNTKLDIYIDNSIIEIKINNEKWYTSRIYFNKNIKIFRKEV